MPLHILRQDITKMHCDALVNPTNQFLEPTGGTDMAIHLAAGESLLKSVKKIGSLQVGKAAITSGFNLPCKYVIHTVGPMWQDGNYNEKEELQSCYRECLRLAEKKGCNTVAFPLISSGSYGFPKDMVLNIAVETVSEYLNDCEMTVFIVVYDKSSYEISKSLYDDVRSFIEAEEEPERLFASRKRMLGGISALRAAPKKSSQSDADLLMPTCASPLEEKDDSEDAFCSVAPCDEQSLEAMLDNMDKSFSEMLFYFIDQKGLTDVQCYKKANVDKKTFSKIKCKKDYRPSKQTALSFAVALELNLEETEKLLNTVGFALSNSSRFDIIVKYFIINGIYNIFKINETLFEFDQMLLGSL